MRRSTPSSRGWLRTACSLLALAGIAALGIGAAADDNSRPSNIPAPARIRFDRDIRPILSDRCFMCHGPDASKRKADLRLDVAEDAIRERDGIVPISPRDLQNSDAWIRVNSTEKDEAMPPPGSGKQPLSPQQLELLRRWIESGAEYEPHWSFVPPVRPAVPDVGKDAACRNEIDRFVLASLAEHDVTPSPPADRSTLLRRVFFDLTGLPPTPAELDEYLADASPDAYERWVDRLLTTEPYRTRMAERMASPWLDAARYADTNGIHTDAGRQIWPFRDWVLRAFRDDIPFDRFVREQLAGDLLDNPTDDQKVASGFNRCHIMTDEGGAIPEEYLVEYAADRTITTSSVFLGLTVGCARCHDHKYDPITTEDFYSLTAFFNSVEEPGLYSQLPDSNRAFEPFMLVPDPAQRAQLASLDERQRAVKAELERRDPKDDAAYSAFIAQTPSRAGVAWTPTRIASAVSKGGASTQIEEGDVAVFSGANPADEEQELRLEPLSPGPYRLLMVEALPDPTSNRVGRADNGNAVVTGITLSLPGTEHETPVPFTWAWADRSQQNGDFDITNVIDPDDSRGWALNGHMVEGGRVAILLASQPFDAANGLTVRVRSHSQYKQHTLSRIRVRVGTISDEGLGMLPAAPTRWRLAGPFPTTSREEGYTKNFGPEEGDVIDLKRNFGAGNQYWRFAEEVADGRVNPLADGSNVTYVGKTVYAAAATDVHVSLGSDDGFQLWVNGAKVAERQVERSGAPDQDSADFKLRPGPNAVVLKIINTGGNGAAYYKPSEQADLAGDLMLALLPKQADAPGRAARLESEWRGRHSPRHKELRAQGDELSRQRSEIEKTVPRTMIMKELPTPRETFVLTRGQYDQPDRKRPVTRRTPLSLGALPPGAPSNRRGLAEWLLSAENPLTARVAVNHLWELFFGAGLVRTSEDFGLQGEYPTHPELLDWLAVEYREHAWSTSHIIRLIVTSATYRQSSVFRPQLAEVDADNRLLARFSPRRLTAEQLRDQALYLSGLLVERLGGPSVRPYQPPGLWQEVAMPASNTRFYVQGRGEELYRRSLYTYWKRAVPPPSMATFDAPTRESCVVRRVGTSTPLQALVLWNDEQFVEAARVFAARVIADASTDDARIDALFRRCTARLPDAAERASIASALADFRAAYTSDPQSASMLVSTGESPVPEGISRSELAAWTMVTSAIMNLHETIMQR